MLGANLCLTLNVSSSSLLTLPNLTLLKPHPGLEGSTYSAFESCFCRFLNLFELHVSTGKMSLLQLAAVKS